MNNEHKNLAIGFTCGWICLNQFIPPLICCHFRPSVAIILTFCWMTPKQYLQTLQTSILLIVITSNVVQYSNVCLSPKFIPVAQSLNILGSIPRNNTNQSCDSSTSFSIFWNYMGSSHLVQEQPHWPFCTSFHLWMRRMQTGHSEFSAQKVLTQCYAVTGCSWKGSRG